MKKIIELKNISKSFDGEKVLDNICLDICPRRNYIIIIL